MKQLKVKTQRVKIVSKFAIQQNKIDNRVTRKSRDEKWIASSVALAFKIITEKQKQVESFTIGKRAMYTVAQKMFHAEIQHQGV